MCKIIASFRFILKSANNSLIKNLFAHSFTGIFISFVTYRLTLSCIISFFKQARFLKAIFCLFLIAIPYFIYFINFISSIIVFHLILSIIRKRVCPHLPSIMGISNSFVQKKERKKSSMLAKHLTYHQYCLKRLFFTYKSQFFWWNKMHTFIFDYLIAVMLCDWFVIIWAYLRYLT